FSAHAMAASARGARPKSSLRPRRRAWGLESLEALEERSLLSTVMTNADDGAGSLRAALVAANDGTHPRPITFSISGSGVQTINLLSPLPTLNVPITIDGTTQTGYAGKPLIQLNGTGAGTGAFGLVIAGGNSTIEGLIINRFDGANLVLQG